MFQEEKVDHVVISDLHKGSYHCVVRMNASHSVISQSLPSANGGTLILELHPLNQEIPPSLWPLSFRYASIHSRIHSLAHSLIHSTGVYGGSAVCLTSSKHWEQSP